MFLLLIVNKVFAFQVNYKSTDTHDLRTRIANKMWEFNKENKIQVNKFYSHDSTIVFGRNKLKSF